MSLKPRAWMPQATTSAEIAALIRERVQYCVQQHRALDVQAAIAGVMPLLSSMVSVSRSKSKGKLEAGERTDADAWQTHLLLAFQLLRDATGITLRFS